MTSTTTYRISGDAEILATIAYQLGFQPHESLVEVAVLPDGKIGLVARVDLEHARESAQPLAQALMRNGADRAVVVTYSDDMRRAALAHADAGAALVPMPTAFLHVGPDGYHRLGDGEVHPMDDLNSTIVAAAHVAAGVALRSSRADMLPALASQDEREAVVTAIDHDTTPRGGEAISAWVDALTNPPTDPAALAALAASLQPTLVRDALLVLIASNDVDLAHAAADGQDTDARIGRVMARILDPVDGVVPDERVYEWAELLARVATRVGEHPIATPVWTLWALTQWWIGTTVAASDALMIALRADPTHRLALLLQDVCDHAMGPGWTRRP